MSWCARLQCIAKDLAGCGTSSITRLDWLNCQPTGMLISRARDLPLTIIMSASTARCRMWKKSWARCKLAAEDPRTVKYWDGGDLKRDEARLTHRIKTLYGFSVLVKLVSDRVKVNQAWQNLRYLMA